MDYVGRMHVINKINTNALVLFAVMEGFEVYNFSTPFGCILLSVESLTKAFRIPSSHYKSRAEARLS